MLCQLAEPVSPRMQPAPPQVLRECFGEDNLPPKGGVTVYRTYMMWRFPGAPRADRSVAEVLPPALQPRTSMEPLGYLSAVAAGA